MNLSSHLSIVSDKLETVQKEMKEMSQVPSKTAQQISYAAAAGKGESNPAVNARAPAIDNRKFNVIFHNVAESRTGTPRSQRQSQDLEKVVSICSTATDSIQADAVSDLFRLGKYRKDQKRPRPILVKFIRSADARAILSNSRNVKSPSYIKPDLPLATRKRDSALLKVRWNLVQQGIDKGKIKIRKDSIYVNNVLH